MVMKLRIPQPDWTGAACLAFPPTREYDAFVDDDMAEAVAICNGDVTGEVCPKRHECLIFALVNNEHYGVFGGLYPEQRHDLRQRYKRRKGKPAPIEWEFDNATPQQDLLDAAAAREADREALRSRAGDEAELRPAG